MKKKLFAMFLTAALVAAQGVTALAAGSAGAGATIKDSSGNTVLTVETPGAIVEPMGSTSITETVDTYLSSSVGTDTREVVRAQLLNAASGKVDTIIDSMEHRSVRETLSGVKVVPSLGVLDVKPASGSNSVTVRVENIPENAKVYALHLGRNGVWELISATRSGSYITLSSSNWSPVVLVYKEAAADNAGGNGGHRSSGSSNSPAVLVTSPQTGVVSDWSLWMGAAVVLLAISGVMFRKKEA